MSVANAYCGEDISSDPRNGVHQHIKHFRAAPYHPGLAPPFAYFAPSPLVNPFASLYAMHFAKLSALASLITLALAAPAPELATLEARALDTASHCGQWDAITASPYTLYVDQWGLSGASSGQSCGQFTSLSGTTAAFKNPWTWTGGTEIKSYTNLNLNTGLNKRLSAISTIPVRSTIVLLSGQPLTKWPCVVLGQVE